MKKQTLLTAVVGALAASAVVGGVAWATIPDANGTINGCYRISEDDEKGQLRVVSDPTACRSNEAPILWNQVGPQGAKGEPGAQGPAGPKGDPGPGLAALDDLAGLPCRTPQFEGQVAIDTTPLAVNSARVELRCHVPNSSVLRLRLINVSAGLGHPSGRVTGLPSDCVLPSGHLETTCDYAVRVGDELTLVAESGASSAFAQWASGPCAPSVEPTCTFVVAGDDEIVVGFIVSP
jgi:hypothetical protein